MNATNCCIARRSSQMKAFWYPCCSTSYKKLLSFKQCESISPEFGLLNFLQLPQTFSYDCYNVTCCVIIIDSFRHSYIYSEPSSYSCIGIKLSALMEVLHIICNMDSRDLSEMYACNLQAVPSIFGYTFQANFLCAC